VALCGNWGPLTNSVLASPGQIWFGASPNPFQSKTGEITSLLTSWYSLRPLCVADAAQTKKDVFVGNVVA